MSKLKKILWLISVIGAWIAAFCPILGWRFVAICCAIPAAMGVGQLEELEKEAGK